MNRKGSMNPQEEVQLLYKASRMAQMTADDHDRCNQAARRLLAHLAPDAESEPEEAEEERDA